MQQRPTDRYEIHHVIGPDEYHNAYPNASEPGLNNNSYTNVMAVWTLCRALELLASLLETVSASLRARLALDDAELAQWDRVSRAMTIPCTDGIDESNGRIICQFDGFDRLRPFDAERFAREHPNERVDWWLEARGDTADAYQLTKQAEVVMLFYLLDVDGVTGLLQRLGYAFDRLSARRTIDHYLRRVTHESSLSRVVCAGALASFDSGRSWACFDDAMRNDLSRERSTGTHKGLHLGAMAGTLDVLQRIYLSLRVEAAGLRVDPCLPEQLGRVRFTFQCRFGRYTLAGDGDTVELAADRRNVGRVKVWSHDGPRCPLSAGESLRMPARTR